MNYLHDYDRHKLENAEESEIQYIQLSKLKTVLEAAKTNPFYERIWKDAGADPSKIESFDDLAAALPMVEKADFVGDSEKFPPFGSRLSAALSKSGVRGDIYITSGTSGQGVEVHAQTEAEMHGMNQVYGFMFDWAGMSAGDHVLQTLPVTMLGGGRLEYQGATAYGLTVHPAGNDDAQKKLSLIERFKPKALLGSTSYFSHLAAVSETDLKDSGVSILFTGLEGASISYFQRLEEQWGAKVYERFGCSQTRNDFMFTCEEGIGTEKRPGMLHNIAPYMLLEVIDPVTGRQVADGEVGEMVVTSLYHTDTPLIRCRLRDSAVFRTARYCPCGRPFSGVELGTIGRTDDVKKIKGINVFPQAVDDVIFGYDAVDEYEVLLTSSASESDIATVSILTKSGVSSEAEDKILSDLPRHLKQRIGINFAVKLVPYIARSEYKARRWLDERHR